MAALAVTVVAAGVTLTRLAAAQAQSPTSVETRAAQRAGQTPAFDEQTRAPERKSNVAYRARHRRSTASRIPWGLAFLPNGKMLVTERGGPAARRHGRRQAVRAAVPDCRRWIRAARAACSTSCSIRRLPRTASSTGAFPNRRRTARTTRPSREAASWTTRRRRASTDVKVILHQNLAPVAAALRQPPRVRPRRHAVRHDGRSVRHAGPHAGPESRHADRQGRADQRRRLHSQDNPFVGKAGVRQEIWSYRPSQHSGSDAESDHGRALDRRTRHARRRRDQHPAQGQGLRVADDRLRHRVPGRPDHRQPSRRRTAWSSRSTTGIRSSRPAT